MQFPTVIHALENAKDKRTLGWFTSAVADLEKGVAAGEIPNPVFQSAKSYVNRGLEHAWGAIIRDPFLHAGRWEKLPRDVYEFEMLKMGNYPYAHTISGMLKKVNATKLSHPMIDAMRKFLTEVEPLSHLVKAAEAVIVKRKPADPDALSKRYLAPMASMTAIGVVQAVLKKITEDSYTELKAQIVSSYKIQLQNYLKTPKENRRDLYVNPVIYRFIDQNDVPYGDVNKRIDDESERDARNIQDSFIIKNLKKLDSILDAKGDFEKIEILGREISIGSMTGLMKLFFKDGATFSIKNSIVWSHSIYGKPFQRFPLTFFDVRLADGTAIRPSEKNMNTIFVGKTE